MINRSHIILYHRFEMIGKIYLKYINGMPQAAPEVFCLSAAAGGGPVAAAAAAAAVAARAFR